MCLYPAAGDRMHNNHQHSLTCRCMSDLGVNCQHRLALRCFSVFQFLNVPMFRNVTLKCLTEIAGVSVSQYEEQFVTLFTLTMCQLKQVSAPKSWRAPQLLALEIRGEVSACSLSRQMLPLNTNIRLAYANGKDDEQNFIQNLSLFLCTFLKEHGQLIEKRLNLRETLMEVRRTRYCRTGDIFSESSIPPLRQSLYCPFQALHFMLLVSEVEETEIFKICLEYWNHLAAELYRESPFSTSTSPLLSGNQHFDVPPRRQLYLPVLSKVPFQTIDKKT